MLESLNILQLSLFFGLSLQDHDQIDEHISQFKPGGKYYSWLKDKMIEDWIIMDCATYWPTSSMLLPYVPIISKMIEYSEPKL